MYLSKSGAFYGNHESEKWLAFAKMFLHVRIVELRALRLGAKKTNKTSRLTSFEAKSNRGIFLFTIPTLDQGSEIRFTVQLSIWRMCMALQE